nr:hypothetical protein [Tanacetum cinerariifolium]
MDDEPMWAANHVVALTPGSAITIPEIANEIAIKDVINEILEEAFDALLNEGSKILYSIEGTPLEEKLFVEFNEFMVVIVEEDIELGLEEEIPFEKITFDTDYKIKTSLEEPPLDIELKQLP